MVVKSMGNRLPSSSSGLLDILATCGQSPQPRVQRILRFVLAIAFEFLYRSVIGRSCEEMRVYRHDLQSHRGADCKATAE